MRAITLLALGAATLLGSAQAESPFWGHWSDGQAELSGYELVQPRYGEQRKKAYAVLVYVTEPFSRSRLVKVDRYDRNNPDHTTVLKLNHVRKFQTGIYDYSVMTSVFADPAQGFRPLKITFSGQEWCGHVFEELAFKDGVKLDLNSYFEGETTQTQLAAQDSEDALFIQIRDLASQALTRPTLSATRLDSALHRRLRHQSAKANTMGVSWGEKTSTTVPAGSFETWPATWKRADGTSCTAQVESPYPHRIVAWSCSDGESARMTGSMRSPYWRQNGEGDEKLLEKLGLPVP